MAFATDGRGYYLTPECRNADISIVAQRQACAEFDNPESRQEVVSPFVEEVAGIALSARNADVLGEDDQADLAQTIVGADIRADGLQIALLRRDGIPLLFERHPDGPAFEALLYRGCRAIGARGKHDGIAIDAGGGFFQLAEGASPTLFYSAPLQ